MDKDYSNEVRGKIFAYRFCEFEKKAIAEGLKPMLNKQQARITKIENNPKNEGQATYACQIEELEREKKMLEDIIKEFSK